MLHATKWLCKLEQTGNALKSFIFQENSAKPTATTTKTTANYPPLDLEAAKAREGKPLWKVRVNTLKTPYTFVNKTLKLS